MVESTYFPEPALSPREAEMKTLTTALIERMQFARAAGYTFGGARNIAAIFGYKNVLSTIDYRIRYMRGGIAARVVDAMPNATWRGNFELIEDEDPKVSTAFEEAWTKLDTRLHISATLRRADILAGLSTYSIVLIGSKIDGGDLTQPLPNGGNNPDNIIYMTPFSGGGGPSFNNSHTVSAGADATIQSIDTDPFSPRFGLPLSYQLRRVDVTSPDFQRPVHWTRVVHIAEGLLDDEVYGTPSMERVWNLLDDLEKVTGGGAEAFWLRANQGQHINVSKDIPSLSVDEKKNLQTQADEYSNQLRRVFTTRGVDIQSLGSDVANFAGPADTILTQIAGAKSIPKRILTGSEMGELASSQDRDNWKDQINGRQTGYAGPYIIRPLVQRLIDFGYLPKPAQYEVRWPHIQTLTEAEKADGAQKWASINSTQGEIVFTSEDIRDKWYQMEPLPDTSIELLSDKQKADGALIWANTNKTAGITIYTDDEIRMHWNGFSPLTPEQKVPVTAPERVSSTAPTPEDDLAPGQKAIVAKPTLVPKAAESHSYSSTQINLPNELAADIIRFGESIPSDSLALKGRELTPHVTVKYGLTFNSSNNVSAVLSSIEPFTFELGAMDYFSGEDGDVIYISVKSEDLAKLNATLSELPSISMQSSYVPHITIAYVKSGVGATYAGNTAFSGRTVTAYGLTFTSSNESETSIPFIGEMTSVLEAALEAKNVDVIDAILGIDRMVVS